MELHAPLSIGFDALLVCTSNISEVVAIEGNMSITLTKKLYISISKGACMLLG